LCACAGPTAERSTSTPRSLAPPSRSVPVIEAPPTVATTVAADGCTYRARGREVLIDPGDGEPAFPLLVTLGWSREAESASPFSMSPGRERFDTTLTLPSMPILHRPARVEATRAQVVFGPSETTLWASSDESAPSLTLRGE